MQTSLISAILILIKNIRKTHVEKRGGGWAVYRVSRSFHDREVEVLVSMSIAPSVPPASQAVRPFTVALEGTVEALSTV
jgi:hypothetical protein